MRSITLLLVAIFSLTACDQLPEWAQLGSGQGGAPGSEAVATDSAAGGATGSAPALGPEAPPPHPVRLKGEKALPALPKRFKRAKEIKSWLKQAKKELKKLPAKGKHSFERTPEGHNVVRWEVISAATAKSDLVAALLELGLEAEAEKVDAEEDALDLHRLKAKAQANEMEAALDFLNRIESGRPRDAATVELARILVPRGELVAAQELLGAISEEKTRALGMAEVVAALAPQDLAAAQEIIPTIPTDDAKSQAKLAIIEQQLAKARVQEARALVAELLPRHQSQGVQQLALYQLRGKGWDEARVEIEAIAPDRRAKAWFEIGRTLAAKTDDLALANRALERALVEIARDPRQQIAVCLQVAEIQEELGDVAGALRTIELGLTAAQNAPAGESHDVKTRFTRTFGAAGAAMAGLLARNGYHERAVSAAGTIETVQGRRAAYQQIASTMGVGDPKGASAFIQRHLERPDFGRVFRSAARQCFASHQVKGIKKWHKQAKEPQHRFQVALGALEGLATIRE